MLISEIVTQIWAADTIALPPDSHHNPNVVTSLSSRIELFRQASRKRGEKPPASLRHTNFTEAFFDRYPEKPYWERYARSLAYALVNEPVYTFDSERLAGMLYQTPTVPTARDMARERVGLSGAAAAAKDLVNKAGIDLPFKPNAAPGHIGWRWDRILEDGVDAIIQDLESRSAAAPDPQSKQLFGGALILWRAVLAWNDRHIEALQASATPNAQLIATCRQVPRCPARTFQEAVQSFYFEHLALMFENPYGGNGPGRLDYFLWPYLERDLESGTTTLGVARELIDELFIRMHERIQQADGWVESIVVGGVHPGGRSSLNPLSYMMIESIGSLDQTHPSVYTRLSLDDPEEFVDLNVDYLLHGANRAQIYNDDACRAAIEKTGVPTADAAMFMAGGCMEISCQGLASDMNFTGTINIAKVLEYVLNGGADLLSGERRIPESRALPDYEDFASVYAAFEAELLREYQEWTRALDIGSRMYSELRPCYLLSSLVGDCLDRGREQQDGGARYHDYGFSALGITAAADAMHAIKQAVFDQKIVRAEELLAALKVNYRGYEELRLRLRGIPRFGAENSGADKMADRVLTSVCSLAGRTRNRFGGGLKPMVFSFVWIPGASKQLGARADGQFAGERIGHGMTPQAVGMTAGITAAVNSCVSLDYSVAAGGATTMWDVDPALADFDIVKSILKRFLKGGGMTFQGNTTSVDELAEALEHPEEYPNLLVRVGGYSARFVSLSPELQQEIISRYRHAG